MAGHRFATLVDPNLPALKRRFLRHLWTVLAALTVLLPVYNEFAQFLPLALWSQGGSLAYLPPRLVTSLVTFNCFLIFVRTVVRSEQVRRVETVEARYSLTGWSGIPALAALGLYLALHYEIKHDFYYRVLGWNSEDVRRLAGDLVLSICYGLCFASVTRAFCFRVSRISQGEPLDVSD